MLLAAVVAVLITMLLALLRGLLGPTAYDRMLAANAFGTKTVLLIALGGHALDWHSSLDVALLYAMVNFVGTIAVMRFFEYDRDEAADKPTGETQ
jgi:multicomponent Na+:H+ antiporter subunit F